MKRLVVTYKIPEQHLGFNYDSFEIPPNLSKKDEAFLVEQFLRHRCLRMIDIESMEYTLEESPRIFMGEA